MERPETRKPKLQLNTEPWGDEAPAQDSEHWKHGIRNAQPDLRHSDTYKHYNEKPKHLGEADLFFKISSRTDNLEAALKKVQQRDAVKAEEKRKAGLDEWDLPKLDNKWLRGLQVMTHGSGIVAGAMTIVMAGVAGFEKVRDYANVTSLWNDPEQVERVLTVGAIAGGTLAATKAAMLISNAIRRHSLRRNNAAVA